MELDICSVGSVVVSLVKGMFLFLFAFDLIKADSHTCVCLSTVRYVPN